MDLHHKAPADLVRMAAHTRELFERLLADALGHQRTLGTCLYASVLCATVINKFTKSHAVVRGGDGDAGGGLFVDCMGYGHYWVEVLADGQVYVVDITADQFGLPPLIVSPLRSLPAKYVNGDQVNVDEAVAELNREIAVDQDLDHMITDPAGTAQGQVCAGCLTPGTIVQGTDE